MQTNQEWQEAESKIDRPTMPSNQTSAESIATAGSIAYVTKDSEQQMANKTVSDTHVTLAQACSQNDMEDDSYSSKGHVE